MQKDKKQVCKDYIKTIMKNEKNIYDLLSSMASYPSTKTEIHGTISALRGAYREVCFYNPKTISSLAVFHSSNVILYSYILYALIPSLYSKKIIIRPSRVVQEQTIQLHNLLNSELALPIEVLPIGQKEFTRLAAEAEVVAFTGRYSNFLEVKAKCPHSLFIFFGSGTNPILVGKNADINNIMDRIIESRLFNSGQDCMCPNVIFVHKNHENTFCQQLIDNLKNYKFGERTDSTATINPIFYENVVDNINEYLNKNQKYILVDGRKDLSKGHIYPTILKSNIDDMPEIFEYFCPVFNIVFFSDEEQLLDLLLHPSYTRKAMGISLFSMPELAYELQMYYTVILEHTFFEIESGNQPFGGWGKEASSVSYRGVTFSKPVLISKEIADYLGEGEFKTNSYRECMINEQELSMIV